MRLTVYAAQRDPIRELAAIHRTQELADRTQRRGLVLGQVQPGAHPNTSGASSHHRITNPT
jgi:hypothetical protein